MKPVKVISFRKIRNKKDHLLKLDMPKDVKKFFYEEALKDATITVKDLIFQSQSLGNNLKECLIAAKFVKALITSLEKLEKTHDTKRRNNNR